MFLTDGRSLPFIIGKAPIKVQLGFVEEIRGVWIANIGLDGILGKDFM